VNLFLVREKKLHALRRTAWDRSLNGPALSSYEAKVVQVTTLLINKLTARAGTPVDISRWFRFLSFDVMGEIGLGKSYGMLESDKMHPAVTGLVDGQWYFGIFGAIPWAVRLLFSIPGAGGQLVAFQRWCQAEMSARIKVCRCCI